ncbi:DUF4255 domain-containing protein [Desulfobacter postgatei]|uniref:DUF4255 domain-containing protein n=1 Tax=Desulfobacter postgatei TaxID=2293 RepID=UPI00259BB6F0|nr:DUF4255 domain-containing protein [uncultured Desulfobacter sp.]
MASNSAIRDVTSTLQSLLESDMSTPNLEVSATSPKSISLDTDHLINIFLYQVTENPFAKNQPPLVRGATGTTRGPLSLNLYYLITPYVTDTLSTLDEHLILGDALRVLYDNAVVSGTMLQGDLAGTGTQIKLGLCRMNLEEQTRIWNALQIPYRLSVSYEAKVVFIDSETDWDVRRVTTMETRYGTY